MSDRQQPATLPPPYTGGRPTRGLYVCERCGTGFVARLRDMVKTHPGKTCMPETLRFRRDDAVECFKLLRELPDDVRGH